MSVEQFIQLLQSVSPPYLTMWTRLEPITPEIGLCIVGRPATFPPAAALPTMQPRMPPPQFSPTAPAFSLPSQQWMMMNMNAFAAQQAHTMRAMVQQTLAQPQQEDADAEDSLPPDDLLFSPAAHAQYRRVSGHATAARNVLRSALRVSFAAAPLMFAVRPLQVWEELLATELESPNADQCKANRDGIEISCADPLKPKGHLKAHFALVLEP